MCYKDDVREAGSAAGATHKHTHATKSSGGRECTVNYVVTEPYPEEEIGNSEHMCRMCCMHG